MRSLPPAQRLRAHGLLGLVVLAAVVGIAIASYLQVFTPVMRVSLEADRAGLLLEPGADVRLRGITIGQVRSVEPGPDGGAVLELALDPELARRVPADAAAELTSSTVFGAKNVNLIVADGPVAKPISDGSQIRARHVTTEINDVFAGLQDVLTKVRPSELNETLGTLAAALDGRGARLGAYVTQLNDYLGEINPSLGVLETDVRSAADVADIYARATPDVLDIVRNAGKTSRTLSEVEATLHAFLLDVSGSARKGSAFLTELERPLITSMDVLEPTLRLLRRYSPMLPCTLAGLNEDRRRIEGLHSGIQANGHLLPGQNSYEYPRDLPKFVTGNGPHCFELPYVRDSQIPTPRYVFDDGIHVFEGDPGIQPGDPPIEVFEELFGTAPPGVKPR